jgi:foldase protein PrsA
MRKVLFVILLWTTALPSVEDEIVVWVNSDVITKREVSSLSLDAMVNQRLLVQEAERRQITISDSAVDEVYQSYKRKGLDEYGLREKIREEMMRAQLLSLIRERVRVAEKEILERLAQYQKEAEISYALFSDKKEAEEVFVELKRNGTTTYPLKKIGSFCYPEMREEFSKIAFSLEEGQISHPFEIDGQFYIIICGKIRETSIESLQRIKGELLGIELKEDKDREELLNDIANLLEEEMREREFRRRVSQLIEELRERAYIRLKAEE